MHVKRTCWNCCACQHDCIWMEENSFGMFHFVTIYVCWLFCSQLQGSKFPERHLVCNNTVQMLHHLHCIADDLSSCITPRSCSQMRRQFAVIPMMQSPMFQF